MEINKSSGIIFHPTSLPSKYGIGDFGVKSYEFVDMLSSSGTKVWQVLPLGFTDNIEYSPYSSQSSILGNPYIISLDDLNNEIISKDVLNEFSGLSNSEVEYKKVYSCKNHVFNNIAKLVNIDDPEYQKFLNNELIKKHLTFITLSEAFNKSWNLWDSEYLDFSDKLFDEVVSKYRNIFAKHLFLQFEFNQQWQKLKSYANNKNISVLGDIPIYVNHNSADVWLNKNLFDLDDKYNMEFVSGAVPDDFTTDGQIWNTTLYKWEEHLKDDYKYWKQKLNQNLQNFDYLRIDHFVGFFQFWAIPFAESALNGHWRDGPWKTFFNIVSKDVNFDKLLAEDLGVELKELSMKKILHTEANPLTRATTNRPVYAQIGINLTTDGVNAISQVRIYPTPTVDTSLHVDFFKKPATPKWAYVVVQGKALYNASATDLQDFELHVSEEENLVTRILGLSGVAMRSPDIAQAGVMDKQSIKQSQND